MSDENHDPLAGTFDSIKNRNARAQMWGRLTNREVISKEKQRRELLELLYAKNITREQLDGLHALDKELGDYDLFEVLFNEIEELDSTLATAVKYLKQGKAQFTPNTTNSLVDDFIDRWEIKK